MNTPFFAGTKFFLRHRVSSLVAALALSIPLIVAVLGVVSDGATRPSAELQTVAKVGNGAGLILPLVSDSSDTNAISASAVQMMKVVGNNVSEVDLILDVEGVVAGRALTVNLDQRDWTAPVFSGMLRRVEGGLPRAPTEVTMSSAFAQLYHVQIGQVVQVAGVRLSLVGIYERPFALRSLTLFIPRTSPLIVSSSGNATILKQYVVDQPLNDAVVARLESDRWIYRTGDNLVTKSSVLTKTPFAHAVVLFLGFLGLIWGMWSLSGRRRRLAARTMIELGASSGQMIGAACVESACAAVLGAAIAGVALAVFAPLVHRSIAADAGIVDEPGWFPLGFSISITVVVGASVMAAASIFQLRLLLARQARQIIPSETGRDRSLEHRTRLATPGRLRTIFGWVALTTIAVAVTGVIWATTDHLDALADPGTRRAGDVEIVLPDGEVPAALQSSLAQRFPGSRSVVQVAEWPDEKSSPNLSLAGVIDPRDVNGSNMAAPLQVIETRSDWFLLTGHDPTNAQWKGVMSGRVALFMPELANLKSATLVDAENLSTKVTSVPAFAVEADAVTLNRAKGAVGRQLLTKFGLHSLTQSILVHTDRTDTDKLADDVGVAMGELGISGADIRIGRPHKPDPPVIVVILTLGGAVLAAEQTMFACLSVVGDERRTLRLLTALGAGYRRRFRFIYGIAGLVATIGAVAGGIIGSVIGALISSVFGGTAVLVVPGTAIIGLIVGLFVVAVTACAAASIRIRNGSLGLR